MYKVLKKITIALSVMLVLAGSLYSFEGKGMRGQRGFNGSKGGQGKPHFQKLVFRSAHMVLRHKDKLKITDQQEKQIKDLITASKKQNIRQHAEVKILEVDIFSALKEEDINSEKINDLVDKKYELKKSQTKNMVKVFSQFRNILTEEQKKMIKELRSKRHQDRMVMKQGYDRKTL